MEEREEERSVVQIEVQKIVDAWQEPPPPPALALKVAPSGRVPLAEYKPRLPCLHVSMSPFGRRRSESAGRAPRLRLPTTQFSSKDLGETFHVQGVSHGLKIHSGARLPSTDPVCWDLHHHPFGTASIPSIRRQSFCSIFKSPLFLSLFKRLLTENPVESKKALPSITYNWIYDHCRPLDSSLHKPERKHRAKQDGCKQQQ